MAAATSNTAQNTNVVYEVFGFRENVPGPGIAESKEYGSSNQYNQNADTNSLSPPPDPQPKKDGRYNQQYRTTGYSPLQNPLQKETTPLISKKMYYGQK